MTSSLANFTVKDRCALRKLLTNMEEGDPKELELVGKVQIINRQAESLGFKGKMMKKRLKTMIKFRNRLEGLSFLHVFTLNKDIRPKFDVSCRFKKVFSF
jgi:hypothetical protein